MDKWIDVYSKEKGVEINYQGLGSTAGIKQMTEQAVDFGCTDAFMTEEQLKTAGQHGEVVHIPLVMGAIVPAYNLKGIDKPLHFTGDVLAGIFLGTIKKWNDPALQQIQPQGVKLPDLDIAVVHRTEGSGSTNMFTSYLHRVSKAWRDSGVGFGTTVKWPAGVGEQGNPGVAGFLAKTEGSIGYVELYFALLKQGEIQYGAVQNAAKEPKFILADLKSVTTAAENALKEKIPDDLNLDLLAAPGEDSYPICGTTWAVVYTKQDPNRSQALVDFFIWAVHDGQKYTEAMHYARLPGALIPRIDEKLKRIKN
jgi:phosphate transport system substrate-binding protein